MVQSHSMNGGGGSMALGSERSVTPANTASRNHMGILGSISGVVLVIGADGFSPRVTTAASRLSS